jgi:chaperone modulatory protein CbpM
MTTEQLVSIEIFCQHEGVEITFVRALHERGLITVVAESEQQFIAPEHLPRLEQLARMHYELEINLEGIEAISHMLERVERLQVEMRALRDRLRLYEGEG